MDDRPVKWRDVLSAHSQQIDDTIVSAIVRGASREEAYDQVRNFAQGAFGAEPEACGFGPDFDRECQAVFEEHAARLEKSGLLKPGEASGRVKQTRETSGANQIGAATGGSGPRGAGKSGEDGLPDQWGRMGQAVNLRGTDYFRPGQETPVEPGLDHMRHVEED